MENDETPINIILLGLGGQGIITLSKLLANSAIASNKKACYNEIHGLSQRGGSVQSSLKINEEHNSLFTSEDVDIVIGLEKLETLRYLYTMKKNKPTILLLDYYATRHTSYFGLEVFPPEDKIDEEIKKRASKLYLLDYENFTKQFKDNFVPYNVGMFSAVIHLGLLGINKEIAEKTLSEILGRNIFLSRINKKAFKEGQKWLKEVNLKQ